WAHILTLAGHSIPLSPWAPLAYFWQDALLASVFAGLDWAIRRPWISWTLYTLIVLYVAVDVPLARTLSTPLTWTMARAARGPLADSIWSYVTWQNCGLMAAVLASALVGPLWAMKRGKGHGWPSKP